MAEIDELILKSEKRVLLPHHKGNLRSPAYPGASIQRRKNILLLGDAKASNGIAANINRLAKRHAVIGCLRLNHREKVAEIAKPIIPILGDLTELEAFIKFTPLKVGTLMITDPEIRHHQVLHVLGLTRKYGLELWAMPQLANAFMGDLKFFSFFGHPVVRINCNFRINPWKKHIKNVMDFALASLGVLLTLPLMLLTAVLIRLTSRGPALFRQIRVGRRGKEFELIKFRSMRIDAEDGSGPVLSEMNDSRLTPLGRILRKTHIDELPQFFNVLNGSMSLVGPRPERPFFVERFKQHIPFYADRLEIKPGITGLAQVYGSYHSKAEEKLIFDLNYIHNFNLWLDLRICLRTALTAIKSLWTKDV